MANYDFIELTFDGQKTSDLNLYVVSNSGRYTSSLSPQFENRTTSVPGRPGLLYWGTDLGVQEFTVSLATDKLSGEQLNTLKKLFVPGKIGTLSFRETEYKHYRVLLTAQPTFSFVPFIDYDINKKPFGIYKGEIELSLTTLEPYGYSTNGLYPGDPDSPGRKESGLPVLTDFPANTTIYHLSQGTRVVNRVLSSTKGQNLSALYFTHAGNAEAEVDLVFTKTLSLTNESGSTPPRANWADITIGTASLIKPRFILDLEFLLETVYVTWDNDINWAAKKTATMNNLREELQGPHRARLIEMALATGPSLTYDSFVALRTQVANEFFTQVKYRFRIQASTKQCQLEILSVATPVTVLYEEDNAGAFNGGFIKLQPGGLLPIVNNQEIITSTVPLSDVEAFFRDTYI